MQLIERTFVLLVLGFLGFWMYKDAKKDTVKRAEHQELVRLRAEHGQAIDWDETPAGNYVVEEVFDPTYHEAILQNLDHFGEVVTYYVKNVPVDIRNEGRVFTKK